MLQPSLLALRNTRSRLGRAGQDAAIGDKEVAPDVSNGSRHRAGHGTGFGCHLRNEEPQLMVRTARFAFDDDEDRRSHSLDAWDSDMVDPCFEVPPSAAAVQRRRQAAEDAKSSGNKVAGIRIENQHSRRSRAA